MVRKILSYLLHVFPEETFVENSTEFKYYVKIIKAIEASLDIDIWVIDYQCRRIVYISENSRLLKSKKYKCIEGFGFELFEEIIPLKDLEMLEIIHKNGFDFFYSLPIRRRLKGYITYDIKVLDDYGKYTLINNKLSPLSLTEDGIIKQALCIASDSTNSKSGNIFIKMNDTCQVYEFFLDTNKFVEVLRQKLSAKESKILQLACKGKTEKEMAVSLNLSLSTIKYHKKQIFNRIGVRNTAEAIQWMNNQKKNSKL